MADAPPHDPKRINASPTKEFFIYMLTRDIPLTRAILDLVDNSVDGARRLRPDGNFAGLWVRVDVARDRFKISDNCGGIPVETARNYAFRFGRPKDAPMTPGSVGQFGVGMKRTFFKLGGRFKVSSVTVSSRFDIDIDVARWIAPPPAGEEEETADDWHFEFAHLEEGVTAIPPADIGTRIEVDALHPAVADSFALDAFRVRLNQEMSLAHALSMDRELAIWVNDTQLTHEPQYLFVSEVIRPAHVDKTYPREFLDGNAGSPVHVRLYAGVYERDLHKGGWYVFCNGRLVIRADQTSATVWGQTHGMRQYHPDLAYFRGYVYFDSDDAGLLPWTTTKTGVDIDSPVYRNAQQQMIEATKPVLTFLRHLAKETADFEAGDQPERVLDAAIRGADATRTDAVPTMPTFQAPAPRPVPAGARLQKIQYSKPIDDVERAKEMLGVRTLTAVGEMTFDYFMKYEGDA